MEENIIKILEFCKKYKDNINYENFNVEFSNDFNYNEIEICFNNGQNICIFNNNLLINGNLNKIETFNNIQDCLKYIENNIL